MGKRKRVVDGGRPSNFPVKRRPPVADRLRHKLALKTDPKIICLTMIVKNESKIIERCLNCAKPAIQRVSIVDTGSTDNTEELILNWCKANNIPGIVHHESFKNFGYNRTHSAQMAKKSWPEADYLLLIDADMKLVVSKDFDSRLLLHPKYLMEQKDEWLSYWNVRMVSTKYDWKCKGVTHEYWDIDDTIHPDLNNDPIVSVGSNLRSIMIDDKGDGGCKSDKYVRDKRLLREGLLDPEEPDSLKVRYRFYLAQTHKDLNEHWDSIDWYISRFEQAGWEEECYYSLYQIGCNYERIAWGKKMCASFPTEELRKKYNPGNVSSDVLNREVEKLFTTAGLFLIYAWIFRPTRSESLAEAATMYRKLINHRLSYEISRIGKAIDFPKNDTLFVQYAVYDWHFDQEISICANYLPDVKNKGKEALLRLLENEKVPDNIRETAKFNSKFYI